MLRLILTRTSVTFLTLTGSLLYTVPALAAPNVPPKDVLTLRALTPESAPLTCPNVPSGAYVRVPGTALSLCKNATRGAPSPAAATAIRYAFSHLGAAYTYTQRDSINPPLFDCSSLIGRAYNSGNALVTRTGHSPTSFYPLFSYTGSYVPGVYTNSNVKRVSNVDLLPGDIIVQFDGPDPSRSAGAAGHAQIYLGNNTVIQSTRIGVNVSARYRSFNNEWYFRYIPPSSYAPPTASGPAKQTGRVFLAKDAKFGVKHSPSVRRLQHALLKKSFATVALRKAGATGSYLKATKRSVRKVQKSMNYKNKDADGILGPYSAAKLGLVWKVI